MILAAFTIAAVVLLPGVAYMAGATALRQWHGIRRRRGPWVVADVRGMTAPD